MLVEATIVGARAGRSPDRSRSPPDQAGGRAPAARERRPRAARAGRAAAPRPADHVPHRDPPQAPQAGAHGRPPWRPPALQPPPHRHRGRARRTALPARPGSARGRRPRHVGHGAGPLPPDAAPGDGQHGALRERGAPRGKPAVRDRIRLSLLLAAGFLPACAGRAPAAGPPAVPVMTAVAAQKDVPVQVRAIGTVEPLSTVTVKPQVGGLIQTVHFNEGTDVRAGDLLFTIDPRPYEAALRQAVSARERDAAQLQNAQAEARRAESLSAQGILSREAYEQSHAASEALAATVRSDEAAVETARLQLGYCTIRSPIEGRTGSLLVHQGNLVKAVDGGPLVVVNRVDPV